MKVVFDIGEIGWSLLHRAHITWLKENEGSDLLYGIVKVFTLKERVKFYDDLIPKYNIITDLPEEMYSANLVRNSFLYNNGPPIKDMFRKCDIDSDDVIHGWKNKDWKSADCYKDRMVFEPFESHLIDMQEYDKKMLDLDVGKSNIVIMPRFKIGDPYTELRNWGVKNWRSLYIMITEKTDWNVIIAGRYGLSYYFEEVKGRSINLISDDPFSMMLAALNDPNTHLAVSSQSFGGKLALLQNVDTIMWGHQKQRHKVDENWSSKEGVKCIFFEDMEYNIKPEGIFSAIEDYIEEKDGS